MIKKPTALVETASDSSVRRGKTGTGRRTLILFLGTVLALNGCGKKPAPSAAVLPAADTNSQPAQANPAPAAPQVKQPVTTLVQPDGAVDLPELQRCVIRWIVANRRRPASFEDFAATAGVPIPPPPAGKKYILTRDMHVQLVNR